MKNSYLKQNFHKNTIDTFSDYLGIQNKFTHYNTYYFKAFHNILHKWDHCGKILIYVVWLTEIFKQKIWTSHQVKLQVLDDWTNWKREI